MCKVSKATNEGMKAYQGEHVQLEMINGVRSEQFSDCTRQGMLIAKPDGVSHEFCLGNRVLPTAASAAFVPKTGWQGKTCL